MHGERPAAFAREMKLITQHLREDNECLLGESELPLELDITHRCDKRGPPVPNYGLSHKLNLNKFLHFVYFKDSTKVLHVHNFSDNVHDVRTPIALQLTTVITGKPAGRGGARVRTQSDVRKT